MSLRCSSKCQLSFRSKTLSFHYRCFARIHLTCNMFLSGQMPSFVHSFWLILSRTVFPITKLKYSDLFLFLLYDIVTHAGIYLTFAIYIFIFCQEYFKKNVCGFIFKETIVYRMSIIELYVLLKWVFKSYH